MSEISCLKCIFADTLIKIGDTYTHIDPAGNESTKAHGKDVIICRAGPPMSGWPLVTENDWCGSFNPGEINEEVPQTS